MHEWRFHLIQAPFKVHVEETMQKKGVVRLKEIFTPGTLQVPSKLKELESVHQYHPDVCKGSKYGVQFNQINEAYDVVMNYLRGETQDYGLYNSSDQEVFVYDDSDMWEEWMGWEGA